VFDRHTIERSLATSVSDFLKSNLTMSSGPSLLSQSPTEVAGSASRIRLRGLSAEQTLVLIDGRRTASYAVAGDTPQPDINGIPLAAIERIEVLPTSAAGIYGGGATGGVIN